MARFFVHNEHVLVDGKKMSKSLQNFYTLRDLEEKGFEPLAFRLLVLQGHYRNSVSFSWKNVEAAQNRLKNWRRLAVMRHQPKSSENTNSKDFFEGAWKEELVQMGDDLNTAELLAHIDHTLGVGLNEISPDGVEAAIRYLERIDDLLGLRLLDSTPDITKAQKSLIAQRAKAREHSDFKNSDDIRDQLKEQGVGILDTAHGQIWHYI